MSTSGSKLAPGSVVKKTTPFSKMGIVVPCNDPRRPSLNKCWVIWRAHEWQRDATWCEWHEVELIEGPEADELLADFTAWKLTR